MSADADNNTACPIDVEKHVNDVSGLARDVHHVEIHDDGGRKCLRKVTFPSEDQLVTQYFEPENPWHDVPSTTRAQLVGEYLELCRKHNTTPIESVLEQIRELPENCIGGVIRAPRLTLSACNLFGSAPADALEAVLRRVQFRRLEIDHAALDDEGAEAIFDMLEYYESATTLSISGPRHFGIRGWQAASRTIRKSAELSELEVTESALEPSHAPVLARALRAHACRLRALCLRRAEIAGEPLLNLVIALKSNNSVRELRLGDNNLTSADAMQLAALLRINSNIQLLDLSNNQIQDTGAGHIADALVEQSSHTPRSATTSPMSPHQCPLMGGYESHGLAFLVLWNNQLTRNCAHHLNRALVACHSLCVLNVGRNALGGEAVRALASGASLASLGLQAARLGPDAARPLSELIRDTRLQRLDLRENRLGVQGLQAILTAMKENTTLTQIDLDDPADSTTLSAEDCEAATVARLTREIRASCRRNEPASSPERKAHRKISLTCHTTHCISRGMQGSDELERRGGRLRSPAPSPAGSPIPALQSDRFSVTRVTPERESSTDSSSPSTPTRPMYCSTSSRFKVVQLAGPPENHGSSRFSVTESPRQTSSRFSVTRNYDSIYNLTPTPSPPPSDKIEVSPQKSESISKTIFESPVVKIEPHAVQSCSVQCDNKIESSYTAIQSSDIKVGSCNVKLKPSDNEVQPTNVQTSNNKIDVSNVMVQILNDKLQSSDKKVESSNNEDKFQIKLQSQDTRVEPPHKSQNLSNTEESLQINTKILKKSEAVTTVLASEINIPDTRSKVSNLDNLSLIESKLCAAESNVPMIGPKSYSEIVSLQHERKNIANSNVIGLSEDESCSRELLNSQPNVRIPIEINTNVPQSLSTDSNLISNTESALINRIDIDKPIHTDSVSVSKTDVIDAIGAEISPILNTKAVLLKPRYDVVPYPINTEIMPVLTSVLDEIGKDTCQKLEEIHETETTVSMNIQDIPDVSNKNVQTDIELNTERTDLKSSDIRSVNLCKNVYSDTVDNVNSVNVQCVSNEITPVKQIEVITQDLGNLIKDMREVSTKSSVLKKDTPNVINIINDVPASYKESVVLKKNKSESSLDSPDLEVSRLMNRKLGSPFCDSSSSLEISGSSMESLSALESQNTIKPVVTHESVQTFAELDRRKAAISTESSVESTSDVTPVAGNLLNMSVSSNESVSPIFGKDKKIHGSLSSLEASVSSLESKLEKVMVTSADSGIEYSLQNPSESKDDSSNEGTLTNNSSLKETVKKDLQETLTSSPKRTSSLLDVPALKTKGLDRMRKISWVAPSASFHVAKPEEKAESKLPSHLEKLLSLFQHPTSLFSRSTSQSDEERKSASSTPPRKDSSLTSSFWSWGSPDKVERDDSLSEDSTLSERVQVSFVDESFSKKLDSKTPSTDTDNTLSEFQGTSEVMGTTEDIVQNIVLSDNASNGNAKRDLDLNKPNDLNKNYADDSIEIQKVDTKEEVKDTSRPKSFAAVLKASGSENSLERQTSPEGQPVDKLSSRVIRGIKENISPENTLTTSMSNTLTLELADRQTRNQNVGTIWETALDKTESKSDDVKVHDNLAPIATIEETTDESLEVKLDSNTVDLGKDALYLLNEGQEFKSQQSSLADELKEAEIKEKMLDLSPELIIDDAVEVPEVFTAKEVKGLRSSPIIPERAKLKKSNSLEDLSARLQSIDMDKETPKKIAFTVPDKATTPRDIPERKSKLRPRTGSSPKSLPESLNRPGSLSKMDSVLSKKKKKVSSLGKMAKDSLLALNMSEDEIAEFRRSYKLTSVESLKSLESVSEDANSQSNSVDSRCRACLRTSQESLMSLDSINEDCRCGDSERAGQSGR